MGIANSFGSHRSCTAAKSTIKGTVVDSQGEPIIGASVLAEGTSNGTITDIDGVFRINVRPGTKLKVSFIGYTDKTVVAKNDMKIILVEDVTALEEVEIVAYGTQKKVTMTGAIASVKGRRIDPCICRFGFQCIRRADDRFDYRTIFR